VDAALARSPDAVVYTASGDIRPGDAIDDVVAVSPRGRTS
jgi:hypothetical protein